MILAFKEQFKEKILDGSKIHTIRPDTCNRWEAGKPIHFATGVRTKAYNNFKTGVCISTQKVILNIEQRCLTIDGKFITIEQMDQLVINDGFEARKDFWNFFTFNYNGENEFTGKIIHWTDFKY